MQPSKDSQMLTALCRKEESVPDILLQEVKDIGVKRLFEPLGFLLELILLVPGNDDIRVIAGNNALQVLPILQLREGDILCNAGQQLGRLQPKGVQFLGNDLQKVEDDLICRRHIDKFQELQIVPNAGNVPVSHSTDEIFLQTDETVSLLLGRKLHKFPPQLPFDLFL